MYERLYGKTGIQAMLGSGLMWAWFDAFYMSSFFPQTGAGLFSELAVAVVFALSLLPLIAAYLRPEWAARLIADKRGMLVVGAAGVLGSLLFVAADALGGASPHPLSTAPAVTALFAAASLLCGLFMALMTVAWGAVYAQGGSITATPYVSGAFACAIVLDLPLFFMFSTASAVFYALFPILSCLVFCAVDRDDRVYASVLDRPAPASVRPAGRSLGIPLTILAGYLLVMIGFSYLQHLISFSPAADGGQAGGMLVQVARGVAAVIICLVVMRDLNSSRVVYRIGLPLMIAGCMTLLFTLDNALFPLSAVLIIVGYTAFDLFIWVIFSSIACTQSSDPLRTVVVMRITCAAGHVAGSALGIGYVGYGWASSAVPFVAEITTLVCYCIVIAVVLLLSSEEVFALTNGYFDFRAVAESLRRRFADSSACQSAAAAGRAGEKSVRADGGAGRGNCDADGHGAESGLDDPGADEATVSDWLDARFGELGLTARECEVARQLTHGRTQKWIADYLCISENTVGTHLRRIYQKAGVHTRQQFLDVLASDGEIGR